MALSTRILRRTFMDGKRCEIHEFNSAAVTGGDFKSEIRYPEYIAVKNKTTPDTGKAVSVGSTVTLSDLTAGDVGSILIVGV